MSVIYNARVCSVIEKAVFLEEWAEYVAEYDDGDNVTG